jgi:F5/8 type C domain
VVICAVASLATFLGIAPIAGELVTSSAVAQGANCTASTSGQTQLAESSFTASTNSTSSTTDAPQNAITNAVNHTTSSRFSSDEDQAVGMYYEVNMGSPQTFDEVQMTVPDYATDYARGYNVEVSANGTSWATVASCTGTGTPETVSFPTETDQYLEVVLTSVDASYWWSIQQFFVYNSSAGTTTSTVATTTTAPAGANCAAAVAGTALSRSAWVASTNSDASGADVAANALDGNLATRFSTDEDQAAGLYFEVNLGSAQAFDEVEMEVPNSAGDYARGYDVEVSANGSSWATVAACTGTGTPEVVSFPAQDDQYARVVLTTGVTTNWWSIDEFYLYTSSSGTTTTTIATGANCSASVSGSQLNESAFVASTNAPSSSTDAPQNAINNAVSGVDASRFSTDEDQAAGLDFEVNMGSSQTVDEVEMTAPDYPGDYARGYNVEISSNGTSWTTVASCAGTANPEIVSFPAQSGQYLEVVLTAGSTTNWWSIEQFKVY